MAHAQNKTDGENSQPAGHFAGVLKFRPWCLSLTGFLT
jgi:hypothetical protein